MIERSRVWLQVSRHRPFHCQVTYVNSAFHPSGVGKSNTSLLAGVNAGRVHLCRVAPWQATLCDPIWQVTPRSSRTSSRRGLYSASALTLFALCGLTDAGWAETDGGETSRTGHLDDYESDWSVQAHDAWEGSANCREVPTHGQG